MMTWIVVALALTVATLGMQLVWLLRMERRIDALVARVDELEDVAGQP